MKRIRPSPTARLLLLVALVVLVVSGAVSVVVGLKFKDSINSANKSATAESARKLHTAQVNGCGRTNARQLVTNRNELATYRTNTATYKLNKVFVQAITAAPQRPQTPKEKKLTKDFGKRLHDTVDSEKETIASETWTPINRHCKASPTAVLLPVAFSKRQPSKADIPPSKADIPPSPHIASKPSRHQVAR